MNEPVKDTTLCEYVPIGGADPIKLSLTIIKNLIAAPTKSGRTCSDRDAMKFLMFCRGKRLNPFEQDAFLVGYDNKDGTAVFSLITAHQAFLKRAEEHADYEGMESGIIIQNEKDNSITEREGDFHLPEEKVVGGWARVHRKGRRPMYRRLSIAQRKPNYPTQFWEGNKASEQIVKNSEADALRASFPTFLGGLYMREEMGQTVVDTGNGMEAAAAKLVSEIPAQLQPGSEPATEQTQAKKEIAETPQNQLRELILANECTLDTLLKWGRETGNISDADAEKITGFDDVPTAVAVRLVRNKVGLINGITKIKEAA